MVKAKNFVLLFFAGFANAVFGNFSDTAHTILPDSSTYTDTVKVVEPDNHHCYRYISMQSGISLPAKTLYYHNFNLLMNDFQYGITDQITLAGGLIIPYYSYLGPKLSINVAPLQHVLVGDMAVTSMFLSGESKLRANLIYIGYCYGNTYDHATISMGYFNSNITPQGTLMFNFGGSKRLTHTVYLIGEFWVNGGKQIVSNVSQWVLDEQKNKVLQDPSNPLNSLYKVYYKDIILNRTTVFANVQLRLISNKYDQKSWSFGLAYYSNWGGHYQEQSPEGNVRNLSNYFSFPMPSISFTQKIGKVEPNIPPFIPR